MDYKFELDDPEFLKIKEELEPLVNGFFSLDKTHPKYTQFKQCFIDWNAKTLKLIPTLLAADSIQKLKPSKKDDPKTYAVIGLFRYLANVESFGSSIIDILVLLLVANGYEFHVEQEHKVPRIIHANTLKDLRNASLGAKISFLKRCKLNESAKLVDRKLRNSIAHLTFEIDDKGVTKIPKDGKMTEININNKIDAFFKRLFMIAYFTNQIAVNIFHKPNSHTQT